MPYLLLLTDSDECQDATSCNVTTSTCENSFGSFDCVCKHGFEKENDECVGEYKYVYIFARKEPTLQSVRVVVPMTGLYTAVWRGVIRTQSFSVCCIYE